MSDMIDEYSIIEFAQESTEHLDQIEPELLNLEQQIEHIEPEHINSIFRAIHSIKGGSGFMPGESLQSLSHTMEHVLNQIRNQELSISSELITVLLECVDTLRNMLNAMLTGDLSCESVSGKEYVERLSTWLTATRDERPKNNDNNTLTDDHRLNFHPDFFNPQYDEVIKQGKYIYQLYLCEDSLKASSKSVQDAMNHVATIGDIIESSVQDIDLGTLHSNHSVIVIIGTVLEPDLIEIGTELSSEYIQSIDKNEIQSFKECDTKTKDKGIDHSDTVVSKDSTSGMQQQNNKTESQTIRIRKDTLNQLMNMVGELVLCRNRLTRLLEDQCKRNSELESTLQNLDFITAELQESSMQTQLQPSKSLFSRLPRLVRDLSNQCDKPVTLTISGTEIELERNVIENLSDPLIHMIRNCVDHGIESRKERELTEKSITATISINVQHEEGKIVLSIHDDGRGIDPNTIVNKAVENGVLSERDSESLTTEDKINLIFTPGFSTADSVTNVSGRGVGMDVVRKSIEKIGGTIRIQSELGVGTAIRLTIPQSLMITSTMIIDIAGNRLAIPELNIEELIQLDIEAIRNQISMLNEDPVLKLRDRLIPILDLADILKIERTVHCPQEGTQIKDRRKSIVDIRLTDQLHKYTQPTVIENRNNKDQNQLSVMILKDGGNRVGIVVDQYYDKEELVVKILPPYVNDKNLYTGASIVGDGQVILIIDITGLMNYSSLNYEKMDLTHKNIKSNQQSYEKHQQVLIFRIHEDEVFGIPMECVSRLLEINSQSIQTIGQLECILYQEEGLPLFRLDQLLPIRKQYRPPEQSIVIVLKTIYAFNGATPSQIGLVVSSIENNEWIPQELPKPCLSANGIVNSFLYNNQIANLIDPDKLLLEVS